MLRGIILSEEDEDIKFEELEKLNIEFVILRVGYTSYSVNKERYEDSKFKDYYRKLKDKNYKIFTYYESCATNVFEASVESNYFLKILQDNNVEEPAIIFINDDHNTVIYSKSNQKNLPKEELSNIILEFCTMMNQNGYDLFILTEFDNVNSDYDVKFSAVVDDSNKYRLIYFEDNDVDNIEIVLENECFFHKIKKGIAVIVKTISKITKKVLEIFK